MTTTEVPSARELRTEIRHWRRGRAELRWGEVVSDAYVALFCVLMIGAMGGNVVLTLRRLGDTACAGACGDTRATAPWLVAIGVAVLALAVGRLLGPVFSPPAANGWLLSTPVDRGALLRPGWWRTASLWVLVAAATLLVPAMLGGFTPAHGAVFVLAGSCTALACLGVAALSQIHEHPAARWLTWIITAALWLALGLAATRRLDLSGTSLGVGVPLALLCAAIASSLAWWVDRALGRMSRRVLAYTENLSPSLSGALSSFDLGLMYDVLLARRWGKAAHVRSRTGGPSGWWALVHRDLLRAARAPQPLLVLAALLLVPYVAARADAGRTVVLVTSLAGLLGGPALGAGLRVVVRTQGLARMLPLSRRALVSAHLVVPGCVLMAFALATLWTLWPSHPIGEAIGLAVACGLSALAATARWLTGKPPNYAAPLVSTPMGGLPPGALTSLARGFDVWALTALPLMFGTAGIVVSVALSLTVLSYVTSNDPG